MFLKLHEPSNYQSYLAALEDRIAFEENDKLNYFSYINGLVGEQQFYEFLTEVGGLKLWDVSLNIKGQVQYDFLVIYDARVFHFDVKNYRGNYKFIDGNFVSSRGYVHKDVLSQLDRAHYKLQDFLHGTGYSCGSRIVFVNEDFSIRGFQGDKKVLFCSDLDGLREYFQKDYEPSDNDLKIAAMFLDNHRPVEYNRIYYYPFEEVQPGVRCPKCRRIGMLKEQQFRSFKCGGCGHSMKTADAVKLAMRDITLLKNGPVKKTELMEWTGLGNTSTSRILSKISHKQGTVRDAKYVLK